MVMKVVKGIKVFNQIKGIRGIRVLLGKKNIRDRKGITAYNE